MEGAPAPAFPFVFDEVTGFELANSFTFEALLGMDILSQCDLSMGPVRTTVRCVSSADPENLTPVQLGGRDGSVPPGRRRPARDGRDGDGQRREV